MDFIGKILDFIFPPTCCICNKIGEGYLCHACCKELEKYKIKTNIRTKRFHLLKYEELVRDKMIAYKFGDKSYLCHLFYEILIKDKNACEFLNDYDIIVPVPIHRKRKGSRGYNQSEVIAKKIGAKLGIQVITDVLEKRVHTVAQSTLSKEQRLQNAKNVYNVRNELKIRNKKVVIFDDIYTTGATVYECEKQLKIAGASQVGVMTVAKD